MKKKELQADNVFLTRCVQLLTERIVPIEESKRQMRVLITTQNQLIAMQNNLISELREELQELAVDE